jgi:predicted transcriptional regulator
MDVLNNVPNKEVAQSKFFNDLKKNDSYPNTYFRVKDDLLNYKIIGYKLNHENEKVIFLTEKGKEIMEKIEQIEDIL